MCFGLLGATEDPFERWCPLPLGISVGCVRFSLYTKSTKWYERAKMKRTLFALLLFFVVGSALGQSPSKIRITT
jgi:hypothetical protein